MTNIPIGDILSGMKRDHIRTIDELIDAFGGQVALGAMLRIGQPAISKWSTNLEIPRGWHLILNRMAEARGMTVDDAVWGLDGFDPLVGALGVRNAVPA